jgi:hypothetical protein
MPMMALLQLPSLKNATVADPHFPVSSQLEQGAHERATSSETRVRIANPLLVGQLTEPE